MNSIYNFVKKSAVSLSKSVIDNYSDDWSEDNEYHVRITQLTQDQAVCFAMLIQNLAYHELGIGRSVGYCKKYYDNFIHANKQEARILRTMGMSYRFMGFFVEEVSWLDGSGLSSKKVNSLVSKNDPPAEWLVTYRKLRADRLKLINDEQTASQQDQPCTSASLNPVSNNTPVIEDFIQTNNVLESTKRPSYGQCSDNEYRRAQLTNSCRANSIHNDWTIKTHTPTQNLRDLTTNFGPKITSTNARSLAQSFSPIPRELSSKRSMIPKMQKSVIFKESSSSSEQSEQPDEDDTTESESTDKSSSDESIVRERYPKAMRSSSKPRSINRSRSYNTNETSFNNTFMRDDQLDKILTQLQLSGSSKIEIEPLKYDSQDAFEWFRNFDKTCEAMGYADNVKALKVAALLKHEASSAWSELSKRERKDYHIVREYVIKKLTSPDAQQNALQQFLSDRQRPDENVSMFAARLHKLKRKATRIKEKEIIYQFVNNVHTGFRMSLLTKNYKSMDKAVNAAKRLEKSYEKISKTSTQFIQSVGKTERGLSNFKDPSPANPNQINTSNQNEISYQHNPNQYQPNPNQHQHNRNQYQHNTNFNQHYQMGPNNHQVNRSPITRQGQRQDNYAQQGYYQNPGTFNSLPQPNNSNHPYCSWCRIDGHSDGNCDKKASFVLNAKCYGCGQIGHLKVNCPKN